MGILNVTPDSFSDGALFFDPTSAIQKGHELAAQGADILDIGAESTRPGYQPVTPAEQLDRLLPVLDGLKYVGLPISIDTTSAEVAHHVLSAGAHIINDVSGGLADPDMIPLLANRDADYICQWWTNWPSHKFSPSGTDHPIWQRTIDELCARRDECLAAGMQPGHIVLDPGLGFGKSAGDNWRILAHIDAITDLGHRVLIGASRKRFLGVDSTMEQRDDSGTAITAWCAQHGVWAVRVHNIGPNRQAIDVIEHLEQNAG